MGCPTPVPDLPRPELWYPSVFTDPDDATNCHRELRCNGVTLNEGTAAVAANNSFARDILTAVLALLKATLSCKRHAIGLDKECDQKCDERSQKQRQQKESNAGPALDP